MLVKKAVYYVLAAGPFLLLGLIAINSRWARSHWDFPEYGPETTQRIEAFVEPVTVVRTLVATDHGTSEVLLRAAVDVWLQGERTGSLRNIPPCSTRNEGTTVLYEQILEAKQNLMDLTVRHAKTAAEKGDYTKAASLYTDAIEIGHVAKYSEFSALAEGASFQVIALKGLAEISPYLDDDQRRLAELRIRSLEPTPEKELGVMVDRFAVAYSRDLNRIGKSTAIIEAARDNKQYASLEDTVYARIQGWQKMSLTDDSIISIYGRSQSAYSQHSRYVKYKSVTLEALAGPTEN